MKLYTIGFTQKSARQFFELLSQNKIKKLVDIRLNNASQLAGFSKGTDLKYFLEQICNIEYNHIIALAPTKEILDNYKKKQITWAQYENSFNELLNQRNVNDVVKGSIGMDLDGVCLLCSESTPEKCHRRLVAEYLKSNWHESGIEIVHL